NLSIPLRKKYSACAVGQITATSFRRPAPLEGRSRSSRTWGGMRWTLWRRKTSDAWGGRRSRVILTPRRWRQGLRDDPQDDGGKRARSPGRARNKPLKPLRGECRVFPVCDRGDYARVVFSFPTRGCGCIERPVFPAPLCPGNLSEYANGRLDQNRP